MDDVAESAISETAVAETQESRAYRLRYWTLLVMGISALIIAVNGTMMNIALPTIQTKLNATSNQVQWMTNIYMLVISGTVLTLGALGDRLGRAKIFRAGLVIFTLASLGAVLSTNATHLIIVRGFLGLGGGIVMPGTLSITTNVFPREERGRAIGMIAGIGGFGMALGPIIAGTILQHFEWEWMFSINIIVVLCALILSLFLVTDSRDAHPQRLDIPGNALFLVGMTSLVYGLNNKTNHGWTDTIVLGPIIGSLIVLTFFVLWASHAKDPILDMKFFKNRRFSLALIFLSIFGLGFFGIMYLLTFYMQFVKGYGAFQTGLRYLPLAFGFLIGAVISSRLTERIGFRAVIIIAFLGAAFMLMLTAFFSVDTPSWHLEPVLLFMGLFVGSIVSPATNLLLGSLPVEKAGISSALNTITNYAPGSISIAALGSLLTSIYSSHFQNAVASIQGVPTALVDKASDSVGAAVGIAHSGRIPPDQAVPFVEAARQSFMDGWQIVAIVLCGIFFVGAVLSFMFAPHRIESAEHNKR